MGKLCPPTVLLTRSAEKNEAMAQCLRQAGLQVTFLPCIDVEPLDNPHQEETLQAQLKQSDWIIFTSQNGINALLSILGRDTTRTLLCTKSIATVGPATALALKTLGIDVALVAGPAHVEGLSQALSRQWEAASPQVGLWLCGNLAHTDWLQAFSQSPHQIIPCVVYQTQPIRRAEQPEIGAMDAVVFASPSSVTGFCNLIDSQTLSDELVIFSIGPKTSQAVRSLLCREPIEASVHTGEGLAQSVLAWAALWYNQENTESQQKSGPHDSFKSR